MPDDLDSKAKVPNYPGNSHRVRPTTEDKKAAPRKQVEQIVTTQVVQRKRPLGKRIAETFTGDDMQSVGSYVLFDVLIPAAKTMISDAASQGVERMLFGEVRSRSTLRPGGYTPYNRMSGGGSAIRREEPRTISQRARATHDFGEVVIETRGEAEQVLDHLQNLVDMYDVATVADLYQLIGVTGNFTDDKYGWTDLRGSSAQRVREGYLLRMPRPLPLDG